MLYYMQDNTLRTKPLHVFNNNFWLELLAIVTINLFLLLQKYFFSVNFSFNLFFERLVNVQFRIYHISNLKLTIGFIFHFIHWHIIFHITKRQTSICTQHILQWNWLVKVTLSRCPNFHIIFLYFIHFFIKRQYIFKCKTNDILLGMKIH